MNVQSYWRHLQQGYAQSMSQAAGPGRTDQKLNLILTVGCSLAALTLVAFGGYRVGFEAVQGIGVYLPQLFLETVSQFGETLIAICLVALIARRHPRAVWMCVLAGVYATTLTHALKALCDADRPAAVLGTAVVVTGPALKLHSFPSGHTMTAFLLAACFSVGASGKNKFLLYGLAATVGFSRVWVGAHWPVDVLVGAAIAGLSVALAISTMKFVPCGLALSTHLFFVSLIAICAGFQLMRVPEYPLARLLGVAIAAMSLCVLARDYIVRPMRRQQVGAHWADQGTPPRSPSL